MLPEWALIRIKIPTHFMLRLSECMIYFLYLGLLFRLELAAGFLSTEVVTIQPTAHLYLIIDGSSNVFD